MSLLEWKTTEIKTAEGGKVRVTHWKKHDPVDLLRAIETKPIRGFSRSQPQVHVHGFGKYELAVRRFRQLRDIPKMGAGHLAYLPAYFVFSALQNLVAKRAAILEMPVALVQYPNGSSSLVTLWKKNQGTLNSFLESADVSLAKKEAASLDAVRQVARLNAVGYCHGHPYSRNFVIFKNGAVKLIDPTVLTAVQSKGDSDKHTIVTALVGKIIDSQANVARYLGKRDEKRLTSTFSREYDRIYDYYKFHRKKGIALHWAKLLAALRSERGSNI